MARQHATPEDLCNDARDATVPKALTGPLWLIDVALNHHELEPGDSFPGGLQTHMNQERAFSVIDGVATFETLDGAHTVGAGKAVRFAPGEYQEGRDESDGRVRALGVGAPQGSKKVRVPIGCRECGDADSLVPHVDE